MIPVVSTRKIASLQYLFNTRAFKVKVKVKEKQKKQNKTKQKQTKTTKKKPNKNKNKEKLKENIIIKEVDINTYVNTCKGITQ